VNTTTMLLMAAQIRQAHPNLAAQANLSKDL